jgi:hypothetical protein
MFLPPESGFYGTISQSYYLIYIMSEILIIAGVVVFFKGCMETNNLAHSSKSATAEG